MAQLKLYLMSNEGLINAKRRIAQCLDHEDNYDLFDEIDEELGRRRIALMTLGLASGLSVPEILDSVEKLI